MPSTRFAPKYIFFPAFTKVGQSKTSPKYALLTSSETTVPAWGVPKH